MQEKHNLNNNYTMTDHFISGHRFIQFAITYKLCKALYLALNDIKECDIYLFIY